MSLLVSSGGGGGGPITASDITDSSASGRTVLTGTAVQARQALGFGGTVTVAQLNALAATERDKPYYCSDCLTVNGPGSVVMWCSRTSTWRTMDDCLLATTDFAAWANDYIVNSNSSEIRGSKGGMFRAFDTTPGINFSVGNSATRDAASTTAMPFPHRRFATNTNANGYGRALAISVGGIATSSVKLLSGIRRNLPSTVSGITLRVGITSNAAVTNAITTYEDSLCIDPGNVLGAINAGLSSKYCACLRANSVNQPGTGATAAETSTSTPADLLVVRDLGAVSMYVNGINVASGTSHSLSSVLYPFMVFANDGTSTTSASLDYENFVFGYYLP